LSEKKRAEKKALSSDLLWGGGGALRVHNSGRAEGLQALD